MNCPGCGRELGPESVLGQLGNLLHYTCRYCGAASFEAIVDEADVDPVDVVCGACGDPLDGALFERAVAGDDDVWCADCERHERSVKFSEELADEVEDREEW